MCSFNKSVFKCLSGDFECDLSCKDYCFFLIFCFMMGSSLTSKVSISNWSDYCVLNLDLPMLDLFMIWLCKASFWGGSRSDIICLYPLLNYLTPVCGLTFGFILFGADSSQLLTSNCPDYKVTCWSLLYIWMSSPSPSLIDSFVLFAWVL